jgi:hypothetical protein
VAANRHNRFLTVYHTTVLPAASCAVHAVNGHMALRLEVVNRVGARVQVLRRVSLAVSLN